MRAKPDSPRRAVDEDVSLASFLDLNAKFTTFVREELAGKYDLDVSL